jgi:hypothetical protein
MKPIERRAGEDPIALLERVRTEIVATLTRWRQPTV